MFAVYFWELKHGLTIRIKWISQIINLQVTKVWVWVLEFEVKTKFSKLTIRMSKQILQP